MKKYKESLLMNGRRNIKRPKLLTQVFYYFEICAKERGILLS